MTYISISSQFLPLECVNFQSIAFLQFVWLKHVKYLPQCLYHWQAQTLASLVLCLQVLSGSLLLRQAGLLSAASQSVDSSVMSKG